MKKGETRKVIKVGLSSKSRDFNKKLRAMTKIFMFIGVLAGLWTPVAVSAEPPERDLLFHVSFDKMTASADYAAGTPNSTDFKSNLEFRPFEGFDGKNAFLRNEGETLTYDIHKNFNPVEGTFSIWINPVNWEPKGEGLTALGHKHFLSVSFENETGNAVLSLYKYYTQSDIGFLITTALNKRNWLALAPGEPYKKGEWIKLNATWAEGKMVFYVNGQEVNSCAYEKAYEDVAGAGIKSGKIMINPILWGGEHEPWSNQTAVDEVKIYGRALSAAEISKSYQAESGQVVVQKEIPAILIAGLDLDDGRLDRMMA
ncbi:MAG: LamG-like jellyroll fold domain-containing protein, partial [Rectinemataceae bacterium]|nr:LamG-like jellyroll fold domain-containing protein [Rectinemataceae bacterium]